MVDRWQQLLDELFLANRMGTGSLVTHDPATPAAVTSMAAITRGGGHA